MSLSQMERLKKPSSGGKSSSEAKKDSKKPRIRVLGKTAVSAEAENAINAFIQATISTGVEGIKKEFSESLKGIQQEGPHHAFDKNPDKNRYKDIYCLDSTRVTLSLCVPPESDYVHANTVKMEHLDRTFIATQGPLENTISDFWRLVFQENVVAVLMLCKCEEDGKNKCCQYWPLDQGSYKNYGPMFVNNKKVDKEDRFYTYTLEILPDGCSNSNIVKLYQISDWPDKGVPPSGMSILRLLKMISTPQMTAGPCVIHCSAGVGRTGTLVAIETAIARLWKGQNINMKDIVLQMRTQRAFMVQTEIQYIFTHLAVMYYISAKMPKHREAIKTFHDSYKQTLAADQQ